MLGYAIPLTLLIALLSLVLSPWALRKADEFKRKLDSRDDVSAATPGHSANPSRPIGCFSGRMWTRRKNASAISLCNPRKTAKNGTMVAKQGYQETMPNGDRFLVMLNGTRYEGTPGQADFKIVEFERYAHAHR